MYARALILLSVVMFGTSCRYRDPSIDLLEGELRWMEDQLFMLEDELDAKSAELAACRATDAGFGVPTPASPQYSSPDYTILPDEPMTMPSVDLPPLQAPQFELPPPDGSVDLPASPPGTLPEYTPQQPTIELPPANGVPRPATPNSSAGSAPPEYQIIEPTVELPPDDAGFAPTPAEPSALEPSDSTLPLPGDPPQLDNPPTDGQSPTGARGNNVQLQSFFLEAPRRAHDGGSTAALDAHVTHIVVQGEITTAYDFDDKPTEPGLLVVVEPRNSDGRYVALAGPLSVVVLDGNQRGTAARVARWDFDAGEARRRIRKSSRGRGVHLVLPWPAAPPESSDLQLFVRYTNVEGRALEADVMLANGRSSDRWNAARRRDKWSATSAPRGVPINTTPIKSLPIANPDDIELRPIPPRDDGVAAASYAAPQRGAGFATVPIPPQSPDLQGNSAAPQPLPPVSGASASLVEMPVIRNIQRPEWKPYR